MEFIVEGITYQSRKFDAFKQLHVSRRLAPIFGGLASAMKEGADSSFGPILALAEAISTMNDDTVDYILNTCLAVVQRQQGQAWASVIAPNGKLMFPDIEMGEMLQIVANVIRDNFAKYFPGAAGAEAATLTT